MIVPPAAPNCFKPFIHFIDQPRQFLSHFLDFS
jgi:hypothetical protein